MSENKELMGMVEVGDGIYLKADADKIARWVMLLAGLVELSPEAAVYFKRGTKKLARRAQAQYPQLESGEPVSLSPSDLDGVLDQVMADHFSKLTFVMVTGDVLFTCIDGPTVASGVLCRAIDDMTPAHN